MPKGSRAVGAMLLLAFGICHLAFRPLPPASTLALFLLGHRIGEERSTVTGSADGGVLTSHFEYLDRGTKVALDSTLAFAPDFTPLSFESLGKSYRYFAVDASVTKASTSAKATVGKSGAPASFTLEGMAPIAVQGVLIRYWMAHGRPETITAQPSGDPITVREVLRTTTHVAGLPGQLRQFTIDGATWGRQRIWLAANDLHVAAAVTSAGVLGFEAVEPALEHASDLFVRAAIRSRLDEAAIESRAVPPVQRDTYALTNGRLIDATGAPPIERAVVIVRHGRIEAAGPVSVTPVPRGVPVVDVSGTTILPGLWDMHAHVGLAEWGPVYLAAGVTTARDMGGEFDVVTALRDAWRDGAAIGPRLLLAGLVDGPGPASFGTVTAATADEGRAAVLRYKDAGFQQMKLYSLLDKPTIAP
jgi:hypothetical protein